MTKARLFASCSAFGCGAIVALVAITSRQDILAAPGTITVHTCAAADGRLRVIDAAVPCEPEERRVRIHVPSQDDPECKADNARLEKFESRLKDLERRSTFDGRRRVTAPFTVITDKDAPILKIDDWQAQFYNLQNKNVVSIVASGTFGGSLLTRTPDGQSTAQIHAGHVRFEEQRKERVHLGLLPDKRYGMMIANVQGKNVAYLGQARDGTGYVGLADAAGATKVELSVNKNAGHLAVRNAKQVAGVFVAGTNTGAGLMELNDGTGTAIVEAGVNPDGAGVVRTGPNMRGFGVGLVGLVPSMILGKP